MADLEQQLRASLIATAPGAPPPANDFARLYFRGEYEYDQLPGVHITALKEMRKSPKHYRHRTRKPKKPTNAMSLGIYAHIATLEPDRFLREYVIWQARSDEGKTRQRRGNAWESFMSAHPGKTIIRDEEYEEAIAISQAIRSDPCAMKYLAVGRPEVAMTWLDKETGIQCCGRLDWLTTIAGTACIPDLKSARDADPFWFTRDSAKLDYHLQLAYYFDGLEAITGKEPLAKIIAVESFEPYDVVVYDVPEEVLDIGRDAYRELLVKLRDCTERDEWPGKGGGIERTLYLPHWAIPEEDEDASGLNLDWSK
jgi:exodeoxyribonuclease VIII